MCVSSFMAGACQRRCRRRGLLLKEPEPTDDSLIYLIEIGSTAQLRVVGLRM